LILLQYVFIATTQARKKKMEMNKNMSQMINHYLYGVGCPVGVSYSRWAGIVKFFEKNFGFLPDPA